jgi:hypothetical protein
MFKKIGTVFVLSSGLLFSNLIEAKSVQAASFTIDKFYGNAAGTQNINVKQVQVGNKRIIDYTNASSQFSSLTTVGGYRDIALTNATGFGTSLTKKASAEVGFGTLAWNNDSNIWSDLTVTWDGNDSATSLNKTGLSSLPNTGLDITKKSKLDGIFVQLINPDAADKLYTDISFDIYGMNNKKYSLSSKVSNLVTRDGQQGLFFDFTKFTNNSLFATKTDFQNIGAMQMTVKTARTVSASRGIDIDIALIEAVDNDIETPEPTASLITLGGVMLLGARIRRKTKK